MTDSKRPSQEIIQRYLRRDLPAEDEAKVEIWLLENPSALDEFLLDEAMIRHVDSASQSQSEPVKDESAENSTIPPKSFFSIWFAKPVYAAGAAVILLAVLSLWLYPALNPSQSGDLLLPVRHIELSNVRSGPVNIRVLEQDDSLTVFAVDVSAWLPSPEGFYVELDTGRETVTIREIHADWSDRIQFALRLGSLKVQEFQIRVHIEGSDKEIGVFDIDLQH